MSARAPLVGHYLSVAQAADRLGLTEHGVRYLIRRRTLPAVQVSGVYLLRPADVARVATQRPAVGRPRKT